MLHVQAFSTPPCGLSQAQPVQIVSDPDSTLHVLQKMSLRISPRMAQMLRRMRNRRSMTVKRQALMSLVPIQKNSN